MPDVQKATIKVEAAVKKDNGWYEFKHGERTYSTKKGSIGLAGMELEGKAADVEYVVVQNGDFTNYYLESITASEGAPEEAPASNGYTKARENPGTQRSIIASVSLEHAVATLTHTIASDATAKTAWEKVGPLADRYFLWLADKAGVTEADDIPFGDD